MIAGEICNSCAIPNCLNENCTEEFLCFNKPYLLSDCLEEECLNTSFPISFERVPGMHEEDLCKVGSILCSCHALVAGAQYLIRFPVALRTLKNRWMWVYPVGFRQIKSIQNGGKHVLRCLNVRLVICQF